MHYDSGEVLNGLSDNWSFMGANAMEWAAGLVVFLMISLFADSPARAMPFMMAGWILTTTQLAMLRRMFPDEERGVRNAVMTSCGFSPIGIPTPSILQPVWSATPVSDLAEESRFRRLGLDTVFPINVREFDDEDV